MWEELKKLHFLLRGFWKAMVIRAETLETREGV
jgi:hypothetical protein